MTPREELLALAARLVVAADALERRPYEIESLREDCLAAADVIRVMEDEPIGREAAKRSTMHSKGCLVRRGGGCTCAVIL